MLRVGGTARLLGHLLDRFLHLSVGLLHVLELLLLAGGFVEFLLGFAERLGQALLGGFGV